MINECSFAKDLSSTILNTESMGETFQKSGKQDSFRHLLKISASMYEIQVHTSSESLQEYNQDQTPLTNQVLLRPFWPSWEFDEYYIISN